MSLNFEQARAAMIEQQVRPWDVLDAQVLDLLAVVKREDFVPPDYRALAFSDFEIPLPAEQVMLAPKVEARLLQDLAVQKHEQVLEIGAGSGYMAALFAHRGAQVTTYEIYPQLAQMARSNLQKSNIYNVEVHIGDGAMIDSNAGRFDVILLSGSVAQIPSTLLAMLNVGGRLAAIVGHEPMMRTTLITRTGQQTFKTAQPWDTVAPRLLNFPEVNVFRF